MNTAMIAIIISLCGLMINGIALLIAYTKFVTGYEKRIASLEIQIAPFWKMVETQLPLLLHSPHTPELDGIIDRIKTTTDLSDWSVQDLQNYYDLVYCEYTNKHDVKQWMRYLILQRLDLLIKQKKRRKG